MPQAERQAIYPTERLNPSLVQREYWLDEGAVGYAGCSGLGSVYRHGADKSAYAGLSAHRNRDISAGSVSFSDLPAEHDSRTQVDGQAQASSHLGAGVDQ